MCGKRVFRWLPVPVIAISACGCGGPKGAAGPENAPEKPRGSAKVMNVNPRYVRLYTEPGVELAEKNYQCAELDWRVPVDRAALVCVDCWAWHFSGDTLERMEKLTRENIVPLLAACRKNGMLVIHAPAGSVATRHPNWLALKPKDARPQAEWPDSPDWPPGEFRQKKGPYAQYAKPAEPQHADRADHAVTRRKFHDDVRPVGDEPVILDGEELHRLCAQRGILHLFYIGFNTNACLMGRDYGVPRMSGRGYHTIVVRDCTTGMETAETYKDLTCTVGTIADIEQFYGYSVASDQLIKSLDTARKP